MYPRAYIDFLTHFQGTRDYFECHEVLEEYWKETNPGDRSSVWVFLIQLSVSLYHHRRGNFKGAHKLIKRCSVTFPKHKASLVQLGLDVKKMERLITKLEKSVLDVEPYKSLLLPICNESLKQIVLQRCQEWNVTYGDPSSMTEALVEKHRLRHH
ncbi:DUF309 domain-containing protein [Halobacillus salinus]|uniref:DUF309 domain-containing protein n=1 Tax=Halobacillus salinus TaxID=192814 RepID=UPI0009A65BE5|nr:DUF309 domain-containing protein [Halobacillus salinus]